MYVTCCPVLMSSKGTPEMYPVTSSGSASAACWYSLATASGRINTTGKSKRSGDTLSTIGLGVT